MKSTVQAALCTHSHMQNRKFQVQHVLDVKIDKNILPTPFKGVRGHCLGQMLWISVQSAQSKDR